MSFIYEAGFKKPMERGNMKENTCETNFICNRVAPEKLSYSFYNHLKDLCFDILLLIKDEDFAEVQKIAADIKDGSLPEDMEEFRYLFAELETAAKNHRVSEIIFFYEEISLLADWKQRPENIN